MDWIFILWFLVCSVCTKRLICDKHVIVVGVNTEPLWCPRLLGTIRDTSYGTEDGQEAGHFWVHAGYDVVHIPAVRYVSSHCFPLHLKTVIHSTLFSKKRKKTLDFRLETLLAFTWLNQEYQHHLLPVHRKSIEILCITPGWNQTLYLSLTSSSFPSWGLYWRMLIWIPLSLKDSYSICWCYYPIAIPCWRFTSLW